VTVVWTRQALLRLEEIELWIALRSSASRAERFVSELIRRTDRQLGRHPRSGRPVPELRSGTMRERIHGHYRVVHRVGRGRVEILTVFESHRVLPVDDLNGQR